MTLPIVTNAAAELPPYLTASWPSIEAGCEWLALLAEIAVYAELCVLVP